VEGMLKHAASEWRTTFDSITDWVSIHDKDHKIKRVNTMCAKGFGLRPEEMIAKTCYEVYHGTDRPVKNCPHRRTMASGRPAIEEFYLPSKGVYLEITTSPVFDENNQIISTVHVGRDITERKKMEEQLIIADRLASIGELASGLAHELNNPLTSIIGFSQLLLQNEIPENIRKDLEVVQHEAQRTSEVVKNLLTFARKHTPVKAPVNVNTIIKKVLELRSYEQRVNNITLDIELSQDIPDVMADYFQLQQVFLNIIINAEHFMIEANRGGVLSIFTGFTGRASKNVRIVFSDNGPGIKPEELGHVFDPFFTTKEVGKGTGLGLSICHGIVSEHGGRIYAESTPGKGASFVVDLPARDGN
jgi:PAS domain S-box-containing protein